MADWSDYLIYSLRGAMKKIDKLMSSQLEPLKISIPQSLILHTLLKEDGSTLKNIGLKTWIDSSSMTVLVDKLEKEGLVERRLDTQDRRAIRIFITAKGTELANKINDIEEDLNAYLCEVVGKDRQKEFLEGIHNIIDHLN